MKLGNVSLNECPKNALDVIENTVFIGFKWFGEHNL